MKKSTLIISIVFLLFSCSSKQSVEKAGTGEPQNIATSGGKEYFVKPDSAFVHWIGSKPGGRHNGQVSVNNGKINIMNNNIVGGTFIIDLNSITDLDLKDPGMNERLVSHLKSQDFFDVSQYPTAKFEIVKVISQAIQDTVTGSDIQFTHQVTGNLTMKGITKSISFPAKIKIEDSFVSATTGSFSINRTLWGVNYGSKSIFAELKDKFINDEIILSMDLLFNSAN